MENNIQSQEQSSDSINSISPQVNNQIRIKFTIIVIVVILLLLGTAGYFWLNNYIKSSSLGNTSNPLIFSENQEVTIQGTVLENDNSKVAVDGPGILNVQTEKGTIDVEYSSGDIECKNSQASRAGMDLKKDNKIQIYGKFTQGKIKFCDSDKYYIKPLTQPSPTPTINISDTSTPDEIGTSWKTYTNTKYGYSIK